jgi:hypothetical protein
MNDRQQSDCSSTRSFCLRVVALAVLASVAGAVGAASKTYTLDADFALGVLDGVNYTAVPNQLQLNTEGTTFPIAWIANAGEDTVSKFDTNLNKEVARYRTWFGPAGQLGYYNHLGNAYAGAAPSRTAVDIHGNGYVLNRHFSQGTQTGGTLFKILVEGFIDRNGNGVMDTSEDTNNNGIIEAGEMKPMADTNGNGIIDDNEIQDERIAWVKRVPDGIGAPLVATGNLGRALCIGTDGNLWVGLFYPGTFYKIRASDGATIAGPVSSVPPAGQPGAGSGWTPYGCLIDANGTLWSASLSGNLGKITNTQSNTGPWVVSRFVSSQNYGIGLGNNKIYLGLANQQFDPVTNTYAPIPNMVSSYGIVVDGGGNIIGGITTVRKVNAAGAIQWTAPMPAGSNYAIGIQVDSAGNVLQLDFNNVGRIIKYRGTDGAPLGVFPVGNLPYTYSDATGLVSRNVTTPTGTWTVIFDGGAAGTAWDKISWTDLIPAGTSVVVSARSADTQGALPGQTYAPTGNGAALPLTGRFIQIQARLNGNNADESPILFDLTVASRSANICDADGDGDIDKSDLSLISRARGRTAQPGDPLDGDGDGTITPNDVKVCLKICTRPNCALQ